MQYLLCKACAEAKGKSAGTRLVFEATEFDPAEYERITWGIARQPLPEQRTIYVNGAPQQPMDLAYYNCDSCNAKIFPGEQCCTWTAWLKGRPEPADWESAYLGER